MDILDDRYFEKYREFVLAETGISTNTNKKEIFQLKIQKSMNATSHDSYEKYLHSISKDVKDNNFYNFINNITTNTTEFFRGNDHFKFLTENIDKIIENTPGIKEEGEIRIWSAGCSSGQEAVTLGMVLNEYIRGRVKIRILATDINTEVLKKAGTGIYTVKECTGIPAFYLKKYFRSCEGGYEVSNEIKEMISFRFFNLMDDFNFRQPFNIIFCRNVMIYFNTENQEKLVNKFYNSTEEGGFFFTGHSESLINRKHKYKSIGASIYIKRDA